MPLVTMPILDFFGELTKIRIRENSILPACPFSYDWIAPPEWTSADRPGFYWNFDCPGCTTFYNGAKLVSGKVIRKAMSNDNEVFLILPCGNSTHIRRF